MGDDVTDVDGDAEDVDDGLEGTHELQSGEETAGAAFNLRICGVAGGCTVSFDRGCEDEALSAMGWAAVEVEVDAAAGDGVGVSGTARLFPALVLAPIVLVLVVGVMVSVDSGPFTLLFLPFGSGVGTSRVTPDFTGGVPKPGA